MLIFYKHLFAPVATHGHILLFLYLILQPSNFVCRSGSLSPRGRLSQRAACPRPVSPSPAPSLQPCPNWNWNQAVKPRFHPFAPLRSLRRWQLLSALSFRPLGGQCYANGDVGRCSQSSVSSLGDGRGREHRPEERLHLLWIQGSNRSHPGWFRRQLRQPSTAIAGRPAACPSRPSQALRQVPAGT